MSLIRYPVKRTLEPGNQIKTLQLFSGSTPMGMSRIQACKATTNRREKIDSKLQLRILAKRSYDSMLNSAAVASVN